MNINLKLELNQTEIMNLFKNGSSNQKAFYDALIKAEQKAKDMAFYYIEQLYTEYGVTMDLRDLINGGLLKITDEKPGEEGDNLYFKLNEENNLFLEVI